MKFSEFRYLVRADMYRYSGRTGWRSFLHHLLFLPVVMHPGFKYSFFLRLCAYLRSKKLLRYTIYGPIRLLLYHYERKYGIMIPVTTAIGSGLCIVHYSGIFVNRLAVIGKNLTILQGVTIGDVDEGPRAGAAIIGDNVYLGPGAVIIGKVMVGNNVVVGANCVVTRDVPDNAMVVGVPGRVVALTGSKTCVRNTDY
jgi:serine O-acetyltransferase